MFVDLFSCKEDVLREFDAPSDALDGADVLYAYYTQADYEGSAFVLYEKDGALIEVNGGHCSCNGLEGQWTPEATTWASIHHIASKGSKYDHHASALKTLAEERGGVSVSPTPL